MASCALSLVIVSGIMVIYHDQFWWPVDEGVYAYVAQRANAGDVVHRDLIDLHGGYGNILNALAFRVFGEDLLSLRYPLVAITIVQCVIAYILLKSRGAAVAFVGTLVVATFSFVLFPNPSANWHALFFFFCLSLCLEKLDQTSRIRLLLAGAIIGMCFFTRQLSGVFLALGLVCVLLAEAPRNDTNTRTPAILIGSIASIGTLAYILSKQQVFAFVWAGVWPLALTASAMLNARVSWDHAGRSAGLVTVGFVTSGLPLALWAWINGAFSYWVSDIFFAALMINGQEFISTASFLNILLLAWHNIASTVAITPIVSGIAWVFLVLSVPLLGALASRDFNRDGSISPTVLLSVFWAISALHYQIPIYLFFVLPVILVSLLILRPKVTVIAATLGVCVWALYFQAAQPLERGLSGIVAGQVGERNQPANLPRVSLRIQQGDTALFREVIDQIETKATATELLMSIPMEPQLNFMTGRKSPVRYYGTPLGLRNEQDVREAIVALNEAAPLFVVSRRVDKYLTPLSAVLLEHVRTQSPDPIQIGPFDLYRYRGHQSE